MNKVIKQLNTPLVSVIIPTYNRHKRLKVAINAVLNQSYKCIEIIVVDDNGLGTDQQLKSKDVVDSFGKDNLIKYIPHKSNKGGCTARNTGIKASNGEFIAFLDDDDEWLFDKIKKQVDFFECTDDSIALVYCGCFIVNEITGEKNLVKPSLKGNVFRELLKCHCPPSTSLIMLRADLIKSINGFDETLESFQDYDLYLRLSQITRFDFISEPLAIFKKHSDDRVSVNLEKRLRALDSIIQKWQTSINTYNTEKHFKRFFTVAAYKAQAYSCLMNSNRKQAASFYLSAIGISPFEFKLYLMFLSSIFGLKFFNSLSYLFKKFHN